MFKIRASQIFTRTPEEAAAAKKELDSGSSFLQAIQKYSVCPSKKNGGDLGWMTKDNIDQSFGLTLSLQDKGKIFGPIHSPYGYHILQFTEIVSDDLIVKNGPFKSFTPMKEVSRILAKDGILEVIVPHFSNPYFFSDPTHKNFFGLYSFSYFAKENILKRDVPKYDISLPLKIESVDLIFKSFRPRYLTHSFKKIFQFIFNLTTWTKEFYEENFTSYISCYEIKFIIKKI